MTPPHPQMYRRNPLRPRKGEKMRFELPSTHTSQTTHQDGPDGTAPAAGASRLDRPKVTFGLRMAVLAGVITAASGTTIGLSSAVNTLAGPADTTCCRSPQAPISTTA